MESVEMKRWRRVSVSTCKDMQELGEIGVWLLLKQRGEMERKG